MREIENVNSRKIKVGKLSDDFDYISSVYNGRGFGRWEKSYLSENEMESSFPSPPFSNANNESYKENPHIIVLVFFLFYSGKLNFAELFTKFMKLMRFFREFSPSVTLTKIYFNFFNRIVGFSQRNYTYNKLLSCINKNSQTSSPLPLLSDGLVM